MKWEGEMLVENPDAQWAIDDSTRNMNPINIDYIKDNITDQVSKYLLQKTAKRRVARATILHAARR